MIKKTVTFLLHNEEQLVAKDGDIKYGSNAFDQFIEERIAKVVTEQGDTYYVPFHAVIWVKVEEETVEPGEVVDDNCNYEGC